MTKYYIALIFFYFFLTFLYFQRYSETGCGLRITGKGKRRIEENGWRICQVFTPSSIKFGRIFQAWSDQGWVMVKKTVSGHYQLDMEVE